MQYCANDWQTIDADRLLYRLALHATKDNSICSDPAFKKVSKHLRPIVASNGVCLGWAAFTLDMMAPNLKEHSPFPIYQATVGVFRGWDWNHGYIAGLLIGRPNRASRDWAKAIALEPLDALGRWATEQAKLVAGEFQDLFSVSQCALAIRGFGGDTGDLPIGRDSKGLFSFRSLAARRDLPPLIELFDDQWQMGMPSMKVLSNNQLAVSTGSMRTLQTSQKVPDPQNRASDPQWSKFWTSLWAATVEAISHAWEVPLQEVLECSRLEGGWRMDNDSLIPKPDIIRNPRAQAYETA